MYHLGPLVSFVNMPLYLMHRLQDNAFKLYCDLETGVRGLSRSSKAALFDRVHTTLYSSLPQ